MKTRMPLLPTNRGLPFFATLGMSQFMRKLARLCSIMAEDLGPQRHANR